MGTTGRPSRRPNFEQAWRGPGSLRATLARAATKPHAGKKHFKGRQTFDEIRLEIEAATGLRLPDSTFWEWVTTTREELGLR